MIAGRYYTSEGIPTTNFIYVHSNYICISSDAGCKILRNNEDVFDSVDVRVEEDEEPPLRDYKIRWFQHKEKSIYNGKKRLLLVGHYTGHYWSAYIPSFVNNLLTMIFISKPFRDTLKLFDFKL